MMMNPRFVENALLAQTAGCAREKRLGESKLLCKHIFCYDLTSKPPTIYCQLLSARKYIQRAFKIEQCASHIIC